MLGSPSQGRKRGYRKDARGLCRPKFTQVREYCLYQCTPLCRTKSRQGWAGCVWARRIRVCNSHPEPIPHHSPLRYTSWWVLWPPRTRQKFKLCWWPTIAPLEKKILHREMLFCNCLNWRKKKKISMMIYFDKPCWAVFLRDRGSYSAELTVKLGGICENTQHLNDTETDAFSLPWKCATYLLPTGF